jgi:hypothetical protein
MSQLQDADIDLWDEIQRRHIIFVLDSHYADKNGWPFKSAYAGAMAKAIEHFARSQGLTLPSRQSIIAENER